MNPEKLKRLMNSIDHLEDHLRITLDICNNDLSGWGSLYPLECISKIKLMKFILEYELKGTPENILYGIKEHLEKESAE